jgi:hypothetical protein
MENTEIGDKLRVGVLLDSYDIPDWAYRMLARIQGSDYVQVTLVLLNDNPRPDANNGAAYLLYNFYRRVDDHLYGRKRSAHQPRSAAELLEDVPVLEVSPERRGDEDWIEDTGGIGEHRLDVLIQIGFGALRGNILSAAACGVWTYYSGDDQHNQGELQGFWEVFEGQPITGSALLMLENDEQGYVRRFILARANTTTNYVSVHRNRNDNYFKSFILLPRKLRELHRVGTTRFKEQVSAENRGSAAPSNQLYHQPTNSGFAPHLVRYLARATRRRFTSLTTRDQWYLMYQLSDKMSTSFHEFHKIIPPRDRFWADPFAVYRDGKYYIFVEELFFNRNRAHLSMLVMDEEGRYDMAVPILEKPYHLSYPFVFQWEGEDYMIPETTGNKTVEVYKCVSFPYRWEHHINLMENIEAADSTLLEYGGRWWLFASVRESRSGDELFIYHADHPLSTNWKPHPRNPVVWDVRSARPAGAFFVQGDQLYRPSQNSAYRYGYGLKINRVRLLNETDYEEEEISSVEPTWERGLLATHTINRVHQLTIIDVMAHRFRFFG